MNAATAAPTTNALAAMLAAMSTPGSPARTAARLPQTPTPLPQAPAFTNLINLLLGSPAPETANNSENAAAEQTPASQAEGTVSTPLASPVPAAQLPDAAQLADAMIRSMLGAAGKLASVTASSTTASSDARTAPARTAQSSNSALNSPSTLQTPGVVPPVLIALTHSGALQSADTARAAVPQKSSTPKLPLGATLLPAAAKSPAPAPLAFGMKVTPVTAFEPAPALPAPSAAAAPAPAAATPQPAPATEVFATPQDEPTPATQTDSASKSAADPKASADQLSDSKSRADLASHEEAPATVAPVAAAPANTGDGADDFTRDFGWQIAAGVANVAAVANAGKSSLASQPALAPASAMEALRSSEPSAPAVSAQPATPLKEITVRMTAPQAPAVDVHLAERAGQLHIAVRTADGGLQTSLRQDLGSLVNSLERSGYRAAAFTAREAAQTPAAATPMNSQNGRQEAETGSGSHNGNFGDSSQNSGSGQQQQRRDPRQPKWMDELENQQ